VKKYRKKPVTIEAVQFNGSSAHKTAIARWMLGERYAYPNPSTRDLVDFAIETLEGTMIAHKGDWIIKGVKGEFYPCRADIFAETYEEASDGE